MSAAVVLFMLGIGTAYPQEINSTVRDAAQVREFKRNNACPSTGVKDAYAPCPGFVVDHPIPLCLSGPDDWRINMMWQEKELSYEKDNHERRICRTVAILREENERMKEALK